MSVRGPHNDYLGYKAFYFPYLDKPLGYRLFVPTGTPPVGGWPVMIWGGGNAVGRKLSWIDDSSGNTDMRFAKTFPDTWFARAFDNMVYIVPEIVDWDEWLNETQSLTQLSGQHPEQAVQQGAMWGSWGIALRELVLSFINKNTIPYTKNDFSAQSSFEFPNIDSNRIYLGGYSGGAISAWVTLVKLRDLVAAVWSIGGQQIGDAYKNHWIQSGSFAKYNEFIINRLKLFAELCCHIPMFSRCGTGIRIGDILGTPVELGSMIYSNRAFAIDMADACLKHGTLNRFILCVVDKPHYWDDEYLPCLNNNNKIDIDIHSEQYFGVAGVSAKQWLLNQSLADGRQAVSFDATMLGGSLSNLPYDWLPKINTSGETPSNDNFYWLWNKYRTVSKLSQTKKTYYGSYTKPMEIVPDGNNIKLRINGDDDILVTPESPFVSGSGYRIMNTSSGCVTFQRPARYLARTKL